MNRVTHFHWDILVVLTIRGKKGAQARKDHIIFDINTP